MEADPSASEPITRDVKGYKRVNSKTKREELEYIPAQLRIVRYARWTYDQPSRNGEHAVTFLKDFKGYVHSDGYQDYNKRKDITRCGCWAHLRRKFVEAIPVKKSEDAPLTAAEIGRDYCNQLFKIEESLKGLSAESRYRQRQKLEKPVLEAFWGWLEKVQPLRGSALGKMVTEIL